MKIPAADRVVIEVSKLKEYLMSPYHPVGRFKALFFATLGYTTDNWLQLEEDLKTLVQLQDAEVGHLSKYGPSAKRAKVVTVWIIRKGEAVPRFVTAYPEEKP